MPAKVVVRKCQGGKLLRLRHDPGSPGAEIMLEGDFFLHPEDALGLLERYLCECAGMPDEESAIRFLKGKLDEGKIQIIGADAPDLIAALWEAK